jgi:prepilin-type N-terminal cleavage/methylation domain-containing protein
MTPRRARAFTLVELLLVVVVLAIMASLVVPTLANAAAPLTDQLAALLEADLKRGRLNAMGTMQRTILVIGADRDRWWLQPTGDISQERAIDASLRMLGSGNLSSFDGHRLVVQLGGDDAPEGDVVVATFDLEGNRDTVEIGVALVAPQAEEPLVQWTVRPERTRVAQVEPRSP